MKKGGSVEYTKEEWYSRRKNSSDPDGWDWEIVSYIEEGLPIVIASGLNEANAHLIVAAPDMYEALKALLKPYAIPNDATYPQYPEYWCNTLKALAKAEGR